MFGFFTADFWSLLAYETADKKTQAFPDLRLPISYGYAHP